MNNFCNVLLPNDIVQETQAIIGNTFKPIPVTDRVLEVDVAPIITIESTNSNIEVSVL